MSISPIRIPTSDEIEFSFSDPLGSPIDTNQEWESVVYEVWNTEKIYYYILYQLDLLKTEVRFAALTGVTMSEKVFGEKRDLALKGVLAIREFLNANKRHLNEINKAIVEVAKVADIYRGIKGN